VNGDNVSNFIESKGKFSNINGNLWIRSGLTHFKIDLGETIGEVKERFFSPIAFEDPFGAITSVIYDTETFAGTTRSNDGYYLYVRSTTDAIDNKMQIDIFNYRSMSPSRMIDLNANPSSILIDELGLVKALAVEGNAIFTDETRRIVNIIQPADSLSGLKEYSDATETANTNKLMNSAAFNGTNTAELIQAGNDLVSQASVRFVYDFDAYHNTGKQPVVVSSIAREEHFADNNDSKLQFSFEYSDGLANVAMTKVQAEPGMAFFVDNGQREEKDTGSDLRWIGNGRTVLNNKGNPVKQYEPYFSTNFLYEDAPELVEIGVTPILYYDAIGRLIKTEFPDSTFSKVEFDSWKQTNFDQNDTVLESDWYNMRINNLIDTELIGQGKDPAKEKQAALKTASHSNTPSSLYLDSLGRQILSISHNGKCASHKNKLYSTFISLDVEGNVNSIRDARNNMIIAYKYDMRGNRVYQNSMDSGKRWAFNNLLGNPLHQWDSRDHVISIQYDVLQRTESTKVQGGDEILVLDHIYERNIYGEGQANEYQNNLRGQLYQNYDTAGRSQNIKFDFKGNIIHASREMNANYKDVPNWTVANLNNSVLFDNELSTYSSQTTYDALNRITNSVEPDSSEVKPSYNEAGILEQIRILQTGVPEKLFLENIEYDAKGQRKSISYSDRNGNNLAKTFYQYDEKTFRLLRLRSTKLNGDLLQDLTYTYDPIGNISEIEDKAIPIKFFNNFKIEPKTFYKYDALYSLIEAQGKEHAGQAITFAQCENWQDQNFTKSYSEGDNLAWRNFQQQYKYDPVGNILETKHEAVGGNWIRQFIYEFQTNRLKQTQVGGQTYKYSHHSKHGFVSSMPHLSEMKWNFKDELQATSKQLVCNNNKPPETTYYVYDGKGQRIRKVTELSGGSKKEERIYIGAIEIFKKYSGNHRGLERTTIHVMDDHRRIAMIDSRNNVNDNTELQIVRFQLANNLGSVNIELDDLGSIISYEEFHPFGTTAYQAVSKDIKAASKRYRYTEMERDDESGFEYHSARYYLPWLGRWINADPIGVYGGQNQYVYTNNPIIKKDVTGLQPCEEEGDNCYRVRSGDNLGRIAENNNTTVPNLMELNNIEDQNSIREGQLLRIRPENNDSEETNANNQTPDQSAPAQTNTGQSINIAVVFHRSNNSNRNDFIRTESVLREAGFTVIDVSNGRELIQELSAITQNARIRNLVFLSHAVPSGMGDNSGTGSGLTVSRGSQGQRNQGRRTVGELESSVPRSRFTDDARIILLACRTRGGVALSGSYTPETDMTIAHQFAEQYSGVGVIAADGRTSGASNGNGLSINASDGFTGEGADSRRIRANWRMLTHNNTSNVTTSEEVSGSPGHTNALDISRVLVGIRSQTIQAIAQRLEQSRKR